VTSIVIYSVKWCGIVRLLWMPQKPLSVDWAAIRSLYLQGVDSITLANKFAINVSTLRSKASREGWNEILGRSRKQVATLKHDTLTATRDIWSERRETIRERIHLIGDRMTNAAAQLSEDQLLNKADKIKIATEIAGKSVGLDREEDRNQVNIAILGSIGSAPGGYDDSCTINTLPQSITISPVYSVEHTDTEAVNPTSHPTTVDPDPADRV
jgi:hypothetical protein